LDLVYYRILNQEKHRKKECIEKIEKRTKNEPMIERKRKGMHISINVCIYVDHTWKKRKNPMDSKKEKSIVMTNNLREKTHGLIKS
jgi:hypothetical protein